MRAWLTASGLLLAVSYPTLRWAWERFQDGGEDAWLGLVAPLALAFGYERRACRTSPDLRICAALTGLLGLFYRWLPDLLRGLLVALAWSSLGSCWRDGRPWNWALAGLFALSLPCLSSLQFYLGYPLRLVSTRLAALCLSGSGVKAAGTALLYGDQLISVDAPCSGIRMLWSGLLLILGLGLSRRWSWRTLLNWAGIAVALLILANGWRAAALYRLPQSAPHWLHQGTGLALFAVFLAVIVGCSPAAVEGVEIVSAPARGWGVFLAAVGLALLPHSSPPAETAVSAPGWTHFEGRVLQPLPLSDVEKGFYADFPGSLARYSDGRREILVRYVTRKTRRLHPAADCLRGSGFEIEGDRPEAVEGKLWHGFRAQRSGLRLEVRERIVECCGECGWGDVSEWYWSESKGPWWAVTVIAGSTSDGGADRG